MGELRAIDTVTLVKELESREGVRSTYVTEEEFSKIQVSGAEERCFRYIKGYGPLRILEIKIC